MAVTPTRFQNAFQQRIYSFLEKFGQDGQIQAQGGMNCLLAGQQIDAYFDYELKKFAATESGRATVVKMLSGKIEQKFKGFAEL